MKGRPAGASVRPTSSLTMAAHPLAAGDQIDGLRAVGLRVRPAVHEEGGGGARRLAGDADRHALAVHLGVRLVERLGQVGEQRDLLGRDGHVDGDAVRIEARRAAAVASLAAVTPARARRCRGRGERSRQCDGGTSPGGPPGRHRRATPCHRSLSAIITSAEGSPVPVGVFGSLSGSYVQGASAVSSDSSRRPTASASRPATTTSATGSVGPPVTRSSRLGAGLLVHLGRRRLDEVDPGLGEQDVERCVGGVAVRRDGRFEAVQPRQEGVVVLEVGAGEVGRTPVVAHDHRERQQSVGRAGRVGVAGLDDAPGLVAADGGPRLPGDLSHAAPRHLAAVRGQHVPAGGAPDGSERTVRDGHRRRERLVPAAQGGGAARHARPRVQGDPGVGSAGGVGDHPLVGVAGVLDGQLHAVIVSGQLAAGGLELGDADHGGRPAAGATAPAVIVVVERAADEQRTADERGRQHDGAQPLRPHRRQRRGGLRPSGVPVLQGRRGRGPDQAPAPGGRVRPRRHPARLRRRAQPADGGGAEGPRRRRCAHRPGHGQTGGRGGRPARRPPRPLRRRLQRQGALQLRDRPPRPRASPRSTSWPV